MKKSDPILKTLSALKKLMDKCGCPWMIIGGIAASLLGKPRFTADIDAVILIDFNDLKNFIKNAARVGLVPRIKEIEIFARKNRVLLFKHAESNINVDISLGLLPFEQEAIKKCQRHKIEGLNLNLPRVEDLIIFKAVAHRPQDMLDIQEIINVHSKIDAKYLRKVLREFAAVLEMPEILDDINKILSKRS